jgi:outer membrane protein assembly complex protein YaeT
MWRTWTSAVAAALIITAPPAFAQKQNDALGDARVEVTRFDIEGVESVDEGQLRRALATRASSWIPWADKRYFNRRQFEADLKRIEIFYADRGFPDAKVASFDLQLDDRQQKVAIALTVDEGEPIVVEAVEFSGFDTLPSEHVDRLKAGMPLREGAPRDRAAVQMTRERALDEFRDHGYPGAQVRVQERAGVAPRTVVVAYHALPGNISYFGPIEIQGNTSVSDDVIRRRLVFRPGRLYRLSQMQESQRRLYGLELFEFVNVEALDRGPDTAEVPTRVTVTEGKHRRLNWGIGYGSEEKVRSEVNWRHVNFFGGARTAGVQARWSALDRGVRLNFQQPSFFSPRTVLHLSAEAWHAAEPVYTLDTTGTRLTLQRRLGYGGPRATSRAVTTLSAGLIHQYEWFSIANEALEDLSFRPTLIALGLDPRTGTGRGLLSALDLDFTRNTTGNLLDARRGYVLSLHYEEAGKWLRGNFDYREVMAEGRHYLSLFNRVVLANRLRVATIAGDGELEGSVPFFKRYFLGGSASLRGWGRFEVSPLSGAGLPLGGHSMLEASTELRVPVFGNFSLVLFGDAGNVWEPDWEVNLGDLRYTIGPGIRYNTPIGPIRFDLGYQVNPIEGLLVGPEPQARRFRMHFSIGQAF